MIEYLTVLDRDTWSESSESHIIRLVDRDIHEFAQNGIPHAHSYQTFNVRTLIEENDRMLKETDDMLTALLLLTAANVTELRDRMTNLELAIWQVETNQCETDCPKGDGGNARGPLQIHYDCWLDGRQLESETYDACERLDYSLMIFRRYMERYATEKRLGRPVTHEDMARIWNGGPSGYKKQSTEAYWAKVQAAMHKIEAEHQEMAFDIEPWDIINQYGSIK